MAWELDCNPALKLEVRRCPDCGRFWAHESGRTPRTNECAVCLADRLRALEVSNNDTVARLFRRLNAQKAATTRAGKGRRR